MTETTTTDAPPVFSPSGAMQGNLTSSQGQPPAAPGASPLAPQSPLAALGPPPPQTAGPPPKAAVNYPPMPAAPQQQRPEPAPDAKEYQKGAMEFASAMAVLGAVAGRFTRAPGGAALGAFAAALKGWQSGNLQAYENAAKKWEADTKTTIENNRTVMEQYKLALQNRQMNIDEQMSKIQLISAQYHDQLMYDAAASKNYTMVAQIYEKNFQYTEKAADAAAKLQEKRDEQKAKNEQNAAYWLSPDGQARLPTLSPAQQAGVKQLIDIYAAKNAKPQNEVIEQFKREHPDATAQEIQEFIASGKPPRAAPAMALAQFKKEHPNATSEEIQKFAADYAGSVSYGRTAGTQGARVENAANEVEQLIPQALETSRALPRGKYVKVNEAIQAYERGTSDPAYNDFALANFSLVNAYTRAMNPQGVPRIAERLEQHAIGILSTATSQQAYEVQVNRLWKEVQASKTATAKTAGGRSPGDINAPVPGAAPSSDDGWTVKEK
jgi:hypothetical protein